MTAIEKKYQETGGPNGILGSPLTSEIATLDGLGLYQEFTGGIIYYSPDYGACVMEAWIVEKWKSFSVAKTFISDGKTSIRDYLGFPVRDTETLPGNGKVCYFERGMIIATQNLLIHSFVVYGAVYLNYAHHGGINGWMGYPTADEQAGSNGGRMAGFAQADVYWHPNTGAFEIHGAIREQYNQLGASAGLLGYPISNENSLQKDGHEIGRSNNFEFGSIFWSAGTGAFEVHGLIGQSYVQNFGGPSGELGFPTSDETGSRNGTYRFNNFQNGVLTYNTRTGAVRKVSNLKVTFTKLETEEDDDDLFVRSSTTLQVNGREVKKVDKDFGEYSNQGTKTLDAGEGFVGDFPLRDGNAAITVTMKAWDVDSGLNFGDDEIAGFAKSFDLETFWDSTLPDTAGNTLLTWYNGPDGQFRANLRIDVDGVIVNPQDSANFRRDLFWHIHNPKIKELDFKTYAATFSDVEEDDSFIFHPFNHIYFQAAYEHSAKTGTCFGMCLEAVYALKGRSASRQFISQYEFDEQRKHDISVKFGYQLGGSQINYILSKLKSGELWNPVNTFHVSREMFNSGNYSILCLSEDAAITGGHAVLPYRWDDSDPNEWRMYVANPNSPFNEQEDNEYHDAVIRINPHNNSFVYHHGAEKIWEGGQGLFNGGRMFAFPYNELSTEPRTPFWELMLTILTGGAYLIFAGDAEVDQISDTTGQTYFDTEGNLNTGQLRITNLHAIETIGAPGDEIWRSIPKAKSWKTNLSLTRKMNRPNLFLYKSQRQTGDMYIEQSLRNDMIRMKRHSDLLPHVATAVQSRSFATKLNRSNVEQELSNDTHDVSMFLQKGGLMGRLRNKSLTFALKGSAEGEYNFGVVSGKSKIMLNATVNQGTVDEIVLDSLNQAGQAFTIKTGVQASSRAFKITLVSFDEKRRYELDNIFLGDNQTFTLQHNDACKELILHNAQQEIMFDLKLYVNGNERPVLAKEGIVGESLRVMHLAPEDWLRVEQSALKVDVYDKIGGTVLDSRLL